MFVAAPDRHETAVLPPPEGEGWYRALFEHATDLVIILNPDGSRRFVSPSVTRILGYPMAVYLALPTFQLVHPDDLQAITASHHECLATPGPQTPFRYRVRHLDGDWRIFESTRSNLLHDPDVHGIVITSRDVTDQERARRRLFESENQFRTAFSSAAIGMAVLDLSGRWLTINSVLSGMTGYSQEHLQQTTLTELTFPDDRATVQMHSRDLLDGRADSYQTETRFVRQNGGIAWVLLSVSLVRDADQNPLHFIAQIQEITARKAAEQTLRESELRFRALLANAADIVLLLDGSGKVRWASPSVGRLLGFDPGTLIGQSNLELVHPGDRGALRRAFVETARTAGKPNRVTLRFRHQDGGFRWLESVATSHLDDPVIGGVIINARDVSDNIELQERLRQDALKDPLTGLANRAMFESQLQQNLAAARRYSSPTGVLFIDLNSFKPVNDSLGHAAGDLVLTAVGRRLENNVRPTDMVARIGGDEFAVALDRLESSDEVLSIVDRLKGIFDIPIPVAGTTVTIGASIGWAISEDGLDEAESLLAQADHAMYRQKMADGRISRER